MVFCIYIAPCIIKGALMEKPVFFNHLHSSRSVNKRERSPSNELRTKVETKCCGLPHIAHYGNMRILEYEKDVFIFD